MSILLENLPPIVKASTTTLSLANSYLGRESVALIGGRYYRVTSALTCNFATTGLGGLDTGAIASNTLYYVYICANSSGVVGLVASTSSSAPSGFTRYKYIGKTKTFSGGATLVDVNPLFVGNSFDPNGNQIASWANITIDTSYLLNGTGITIHAARQTLQWRRVGANIEMRGVIGFSNAAAGSSASNLGLYIPNYSLLTIAPNTSDGNDRYGMVGVEAGVNGIANETQVSEAYRGGSNYIEFQMKQAGVLSGAYSIKGNDIRDASGYVYVLFFNNISIPTVEYSGLFS